MSAGAPSIADIEDTLGPTQERLGFTVFVSVCVHVVLILGVGFTYTAQQSGTSSLEITLATYLSTEAPDDADFLAQANQQGSGSADEALAPASPVQSPFNAEGIADLSNFLVERPTESSLARDEVVAVTSDAGRENGEQALTEPVALNNLDEGASSDAIATLRAQLDLHRQEYAKRPRRYTITSAATRESEDAVYLDSWRKRIEAIGNEYYPEEATEAGVYGTLRVMVAINPDGSVNDIRILRSSGERLLDEAALRIVQLSAPFEPFTPEMRERVDVLEVIRTWQFQRGNTFTSF